jgi:hypothetical protein
VFVLTLQQVPRRRLGPDTPVRVGRIDDLEVDLNAVIVDTGIHVDLSIRDSPRRDALLLEFQADFDSWAALRDRDAEPPRNPGERLLTVTISITDDVGTTYTSHQARAGGTGTEWQARRSFLPAPPSRARQLAVALHTPGGNEVIAQFGM